MASKANLIPATPWLNLSRSRVDCENLSAPEERRLHIPIPPRLRKSTCESSYFPFWRRRIISIPNQQIVNTTNAKDGPTIFLLLIFILIAVFERTTQKPLAILLLHFQFLVWTCRVPAETDPQNHFPTTDCSFQRGGPRVGSCGWKS